MIGPEILVGCAILEHVVGRGQDRGSNRANRLLWPPSAAQPVKLRLEIARLLARAGPSALHQRGLEPRRPLTQAVGPALAGALVVAWAQPGPGEQVARGREPPHVGADLGDDDLGSKVADA